MVSLSVFERAMKYIDAPDAESCWLWTGYTDPNGYGRLSVAMGGGRYVPQLAHRLVFAQLVGPLTDGLALDHLCKIRNCVNPDHLEEVTHAENARRSPRPLLIRCCNGHEYTPNNTYEWRGRRFCRACHTDRAREWALNNPRFR